MELKADSKTGMFTQVALIRNAFPNATMQDIKALTMEDRAQLASAHARNCGPEVTEHCNFELVPY